jgi:hypothetical protein
VTPILVTKWPPRALWRPFGLRFTYVAAVLVKIETQRPRTAWDYTGFKDWRQPTCYSQAFPSFAVQFDSLTMSNSAESYLCHTCSCHEISRTL